MSFERIAKMLFFIHSLLLLLVTSFPVYAEEILECGQNSPVDCGYPSYEQNSNGAVLQPGDVFKSTEGSVLQVAKIGPRDFFLVGKFKHINKYLRQRENAIVIAQTLKENGQWTDAGRRHVNVVVTSKMPAPSPLVMQHIRARALEVITTAELRPENITYIAGALDTQLGLEPVNLQRSTYSIDGTKLESMVVTLQNMKTHEKMNYLTNYFQKIVDERSSDRRQIPKKGEIVVTLTAYPPPQNVTRTVCDVGSSKVTLRQIRKTIDSMLNKKGCIKFENFP